jgi:hypothetical protein
VLCLAKQEGGQALMREILRIKQWCLIGLENDKKTGSTLG